MDIFGPMCYIIGRSNIRIRHPPEHASMLEAMTGEIPVPPELNQRHRKRRSSDRFGWIKPVLSTAGVLTAVGVIFVFLKAGIAIQESPAKLDNVIAKVQQVADTLTDIKKTVRDLAKSQEGLSARVSTLEDHDRARDTWQAGIEQLKQSRAREMDDLTSRVRELEFSLPERGQPSRRRSY